MITQKITPFLWFDDNAEQAVKYYTSIFKKSKIRQITRYGEAASKAANRPVGSVLTVEFEIEGQKFTALNGGQVVKFNESVSFVIRCKTQAELDYYWKKLTSGGGKEVACGWLTDKFGLTWQLIPENLNELLDNKNPEAANRVLAAVMQMVKLDIQKMNAAYAGKKKWSSTNSKHSG